MRIEAELDDIHAERLLQLQRHFGKPLNEVVTLILSRALDESFVQPETEGQKLLRILHEEDLIGCLHGGDNLSVDYKKNLWGSE